MDDRTEGLLRRPLISITFARVTTELYAIFIFQRSGYCCHGIFLHRGIKCFQKYRTFTSFLQFSNKIITVISQQRLHRFTQSAGVAWVSEPSQAWWRSATCQHYDSDMRRSCLGSFSRQIDAILQSILFLHVSPWFTFLVVKICQTLPVGSQSDAGSSDPETLNQSAVCGECPKHQSR